MALRHGNPSGDPSSAPRCGARTRNGGSCQAPALTGKKRCRMHGGASTGPKTAAGLERSRRANWKHGRFSREALEARRVANYETIEQGIRRIAREERQRERIARRDFRELTRLLNRLVGPA